MKNQKKSHESSEHESSERKSSPVFADKMKYRHGVGKSMKLQRRLQVQWLEMLEKELKGIASFSSDVYKGKNALELFFDGCKGKYNGSIYRHYHMTNLAAMQIFENVKHKSEITKAMIYDVLMVQYSAEQQRWRSERKKRTVL